MENKEEHKEKPVSMFDVMHGASKVVFVIPLIIVGLAILLQIQQRVPFLNNKSALSPTPSPVITQTVSPPISVAPTIPEASKIKLDLKGPYSCSYEDQDGTAKVSVKNKNISLQIVKSKFTENIIVKGDCAYKWNPTLAKGDKVCGLSQYFTMFDAMSMFGGGLDLGTLLGFVKLSDEKGEKFSQEYIEGVLKTCKDGPVADATFNVPTRINFTETKVDDPSSGGTLPF